MRTVLSSISKRAAAVGVLSAALAFGGQDATNASQKKNPLAGRKAAIEAGEQRFKGRCAACHGVNGEGGRGPALAGNRDLQGMSDEQLFQTIRNGIAGTNMPPSRMPDEQTWQVAAFVRNLSSPASQAVLAGNGTAGRELFFGQGGCSGCHAIRGAGGLLGPDLSDAGANLTVRDLRESILQPSARIAEGFDSAVVQMKSGERIEGVAKDDTNYSISILDRGGRLRVVDKSEVSKIEFSGKSLMPGDAGQRLGPGGLDDLMSFLAAQTVRPAGEPAERPGRRSIR